VRELLRAIWDLHAMYGGDRPWLWRGQANDDYALEPAMHTRVRRQASLEDGAVERFTGELLEAARLANLDNHEGMRLPDLALLSLLQHHGAATPLLDVTLDPIVGLYMAVVSPSDTDDETDGVLFAIRRPTDSIDDFDSRRFRDIYAVRKAAGRTALYSAPDVSERLRIQRGHFLLGAVSNDDARVTIPLTLDQGTIQRTWMAKRMKSRGSRGPVSPATSDVAAFRVTAAFKRSIRNWLEERSGLTRDFVYPTAWHQPHLERFAASHGRTADLSCPWARHAVPRRTSELVGWPRFGAKTMAADASVASPLGSPGADLSGRSLSRWLSGKDLDVGEGASGCRAGDRWTRPICGLGRPSGRRGGGLVAVELQ
jgi:hypothetical protein